MFRGNKRLKNPNQKNSILDILEDTLLFILFIKLTHFAKCKVGFSLSPANRNKTVVPLYV